VGVVNVYPYNLINVMPVQKIKKTEMEYVFVMMVIMKEIMNVIVINYLLLNIECNGLCYTCIDDLYKCLSCSEDR
jgi:hypothetical protein